MASWNSAAALWKIASAWTWQRKDRSMDGQTQSAIVAAHSPSFGTVRLAE